MLWHTHNNVVYSLFCLLVYFMTVDWLIKQMTWNTEGMILYGFYTHICPQTCNYMHFWKSHSFSFFYFSEMNILFGDKGSKNVILGGE